MKRITSKLYIGLTRILIVILLRVSVVSAYCRDIGFPEVWTTSKFTDSEPKSWLLTSGLGKQFHADHKMIIYNRTTGIEVGSPPECLDEFYDEETGYYHFLWFFSQSGPYTPVPKVKGCNAYKQHDNIIREFVDTSQSVQEYHSAVQCKNLTGLSSLILSKSDAQYTDCPFQRGKYIFEVTDERMPYFCQETTSFANVNGEIHLDTCLKEKSSDAPYHGKFHCLSYWAPAKWENSSYGNFIAMEMLPNQAASNVIASDRWPYCGRYNIGSDGVITMSLILSIGRSAFDPVRCISTIDYNYAKNDDLYNVIRMVFTPFQDNIVTSSIPKDTTKQTSEKPSFNSNTTVSSHSTDSWMTQNQENEKSSSSSENTGISKPELRVGEDDIIGGIYWPWWIGIGLAIITAGTISIFCFYKLFGGKKRRIDVDDEDCVKENGRIAKDL